MISKRRNAQAVYLKGEVYILGGFDNCGTYLTSVEKYTPSTNKWTRVSSMFDERHLFCGCAFINKIFIFGGCFNNSNNFTQINCV